MTLTELSYQSRILAKFAAVFIVIAGIFYFMITVLISVLVKRPAGPTVVLNTSFGKIPPPSFEYIKTKEGNYTFQLDTIDGTLPQATASAQVYFIPQEKTTLAYLSRVKNIAEQFGFDLATASQESVSESWTKFEDEEKVLIINTQTFHLDFRLKGSSDLQQAIETAPEQNFTALESIFTAKARERLQSFDAYSPDLAAGKTNLVYLRYDLSTNSFFPISANEVPQAVRVDFFRKDEGLSVVTPQYYESQNFAVVAPLTRNTDMIALRFVSFNKLDDSPGIYPLITSAQAWKALEEGKVKTISVAEAVAGPIRIKQIFVAYYDPASYQEYFQPIFVFLGDNEYVGYYPAVKPEFLLSAPTPSPEASPSASPSASRSAEAP